MKTAVIDSLRQISTFGNAGSTAELTAIAGDVPGRSCDALDALERLAASLALDEEAENALMGLGADIFAFADSGQPASLKTASME